MRKTRFDTRTGILLGFILLKFLLQYILISPNYDLHRDEYLHLDQGQHLAWGYISVPPFTSWIAWMIKILGNGFFWVKFFPALFGALTIVTVWKIIEELEGNLFALILASTAVLLSVILRMNILFQPNSSDIFFWTLIYFTLIKFIKTNRTQWLFASGIAIALGLLSKYNIIFLLLGLFPAILLTEHRSVYKRKSFYWAMILALCILAPNVIWQYKNDFPTLRQLQELNRTQLVNVRRLDFVKDQFIFFLSSIIIILSAFTGFLIYQPFKKYRVFLWSFIISMSLFLLLKAKSYYTIGLYPILLAFGSVYLEQLLTSGWKKYLRPVLILSVVGLAIPFVLIGFPYLSPEQIQRNSQRYKSFGLLRWEDGKDHLLPQDFADMMGWSELAKKTDHTYESISNKPATLVLCDNYGQAGAINYYSKFPQINAVSFNADYINWIQLKNKIENVILVKEPGADDSLLTTERKLFNSVTLVGENANIYSRELGAKIYLLTLPRLDINSLLTSEIKARKKNPY